MRNKYSNSMNPPLSAKKPVAAYVGGAPDYAYAGVQR